MLNLDLLVILAVWTVVSLPLAYYWYKVCYKTAQNMGYAMNFKRDIDIQLAARDITDRDWYYTFYALFALPIGIIGFIPSAIYWVIVTKRYVVGTIITLIALPAITTWYVIELFYEYFKYLTWYMGGDRATA